MSTPLTPIIIESMNLFLALVRMGKDARELSRAEWLELKERIDTEFADIPTWDEL